MLNINRYDLYTALVLFLLPLSLFWSVTIGGQTLLPVDNLFAHEPWASSRTELGVGPPQNQLLSDLILENYVWKKFTRETLAEGELPLWNPYILSGQPFLANGQHSAYYPFSLIFYLLPLPYAYGWFTVLQLWLAGLSMYTLGRVLTGSRWAALVSAVCYSLSTFLIVRVVFTMVLAGAVWLPLLLAIIELVLRQREQAHTSPKFLPPQPLIVLGALVVGIQCLAGHIEITYYTLLVSGYYTACRLVMMWWWGIRPIALTKVAGWLLAMVVFGVGLGAIQIIPMYEVVSQNFRDDSVTLEQVRGWALPLRRVATFLIPDFFGSPAHHGYFDVVTWQWQTLGPNAHGTINPLCPNCTAWDTKTSVEAGSYIGILPLLLALLAIAYWGVSYFVSLSPKGFSKPFGSDETNVVRNTQYAIPIFTALIIISLLFAFGSPLYAILFYGLPGWNQLHSPFRWLFPYTVSVAILAGYGAMVLHELRRESQQLEAIWCRGVSWLSFGLILSGAAGLTLLLTSLFVPQPFIALADEIFNRSGLAQNAFANGQQFFGYQWPNFLKFGLMLLGTGLIIRYCDNAVMRNDDHPIALSAYRIIVLSLIALDLILAGWGFNPSVETRLLDFEPPVVTWLKEQQADNPYYRLTSFDTPEGRGNKVFLANAGMGDQLFDVRGYDSIIPGQYGQFMQNIQPNGDMLFNRIGPVYAPGYDALDSALLDLLGVRYVLTTEQINNPNYQLAYDNEIRVYENLDALPRAFTVPTAVDLSQATPDEFSFALRSLNPREQVILDGEQNRSESPSLPGFQDLAGFQDETPPTITSYRPNEIHLTVGLSEPRWLILADSYFPGWRAYAQPIQSSIENPTSETELTIHRANGNFRAVYLPAGEWQIRFRYSPRSFQLGVYTTFLSLAALMLLLGVWGWGKLYQERDDDSRIKRIAKNSLVPMVMALSNRVVDFAFALLMLRILQPEGAGRYAFAVAFIGLVEILTRYGLGTLVTREVAADRSQSNRYLSNVSLLRFYLWLVALPMMGGILGMYVVFGDLSVEVVITVAIFSLGTLFSNLSDGLTAIFYAHEKAEFPAAIATVTTLARAAVGALALILGWGILGLAGASLLGNLVTFIILVVFLIQRILRPTWQNEPSLQGQMIGESLPLMINHLLSTIFFRVDVFILSPTWGDNAVGFYNAAYKYVDGINVIPQYFTLAIFPLMSKFATDSRESLVRAYLLSLRLLLMLALPIAFGTPFVAYELIWFLAGEKFIPDSVIVLQLLIWFLPFSFINQVTQYVLIAVHQQRALTRAFIIGVSFNLITNLIFVPFYGYQAAAITTIISEWSLLIPFYILVRRHLCIVPWFDILWRPTVAAIAMGTTLWLVGDIHFLLTISLATVVYGLSYVVVGGLHQPDMDVVRRAIGA